jgi:predicted metal-binding protein
MYFGAGYYFRWTIMKSVKINPKTDLIFDLKVIEACRSCKRYGKKATCPPYIFDRDYYFHLLPSYQYGILYYDQSIISQNTWERDGKLSSLNLQKYLLEERQKLFSQGHFFVTAFGGGSCKLCPECVHPCRNPDRALIPLEATGVNVVKLMQRFNVNINFPVDNKMYRVGAVFYD